MSFVQRSSSGLCYNNKGSNGFLKYEGYMSVRVLVRNRQKVIYAQYPLSTELCTMLIQSQELKYDINEWGKI